MPSGEIVKAFEAGGDSFCEGVGLTRGDGVAVGNACGVTGAGLVAVGVTVGAASVGTDVSNVGIEVGVSEAVCEVEVVGERLQPTSRSRKAVRNHLDFI
jgi:hypothetical protein